jgi:uracil-DNA glycosylase family 4
MNDKTQELQKIADEIAEIKGVLADLRRENNYFPVIGEGSLDASIIFIGEAPGENEAKTGRPFVGRAGKFLNELLESINVPRESVYITNIVKDRPPKNRDPLPKEIDLYATFLDRQISIIKPKIIATLGRFSMQYIMNRYGLSAELEPISKLHGKIFETRVERELVKMVPLYHPAVALYNGSTRELLKEDFKVLKDMI